MRLTFTLFFLASLFFSSCTPLRVVRVAAEGGEVTYDYGVEIMTEARPSATVRMGYFANNRDHLLFTMEVKNTGRQPITIDPAGCRLSTDLGDQLRAIDPESHLLELDLAEVRRIRDARWTAAALTVAAVAAATIPDPTPTLAEGGSDVTAALVDASVNIAVNTVPLLITNVAFDRPAPPNDLLSTDAQVFWRQQALRITTVEPGKAVVGEVVFPRVDQATELFVECQVSDDRVAFPFRQTVYRPNGKPIR